VANATQLTKDLAPSRYEQSFQSFKDVCLSALYTGLDWREAHALVASDHNIPDETKSEAAEYLFASLDASIGRRLCITERGKLGLVLEGVAKGDRICVLVGAKAPFVVREVEGLDAEQEKYLLVSDCYIDGLVAR
jgi:hypothetical protein